MPKILITGVAGLLGANFSKFLIKNNYDVVGIDNLLGGYKDFVDKKIKFYEFDLYDVDKLKEVFEVEKIDYVYHFAAYAAMGLSPFIRNFNYTNNVICSTNIINACVNYDIKKLIFSSSMDVYGNNKPPYTEDLNPAPEDPYGIAKFTVEQDIRQANYQFDLNYTIVRPHNVIGIYQNIWDRYRNVIGIWIRQILNKEPITIFGDGTQRRAFSDIDFYMEPFTLLMDEKYNGEIFNIGADKDFQILEAVKITKKVAKDLGFNTEIVHLEPRKEVHSMYCDHTKAKEKLNFKDGTNLDKIIYKMFTWAIKQPKREVKKMNYEIVKNIYSYWK